MSTTEPADTLVVDLPSHRSACQSMGSDERLRVLGVEIANVTNARALSLLEPILRGKQGVGNCIFFVNAHTLNAAASDASYRRVLNAGKFVFGDGTGVRWALRLQGVRIRDNVNGTDLVPQLLRRYSGHGHRVYLLGGTPETITAAAGRFVEEYPGWTLAGFHHGYVHKPNLSAQVVEAINSARPDLLLVGMGNPRQEQWLGAHRDALRAPLCVGVGGLFHYWAGDLRRAPRWLRCVGAEWLGILVQQPRKARRYLLGNPLFLGRALREAIGRRFGRGAD